MAVENVLLVTIDSLRHDFRAEDAPTLDGLSRTGTSFRHAFATGPGTTPSFPGILTGSYPLSYGGLGQLCPDRPSLARELRSHGLSTAGFHSNPFLSESFNYDTGFETFDDYQDSLTDVATRIFPQGVEKSVLPSPITSALKQTYEFVRGKPRPYERAETITDDAVRWLDTAPQEFFAWVHYMDVHHPCFPPESYLEAVGLGDTTASAIADLYSRAIDSSSTVSEEEHRVLVDSYRASLRYVDDQIERLLDVLRKQNRYEETLVIVTSDHGQLFDDFGAYGKPYRLVDALVEVPLVLDNAPSKLADATGELVSLVDLPPTIHRSLGFGVPDVYEGRHPVEGPPRETVLVEHQIDDSVIVGVRSQDQKYVVDAIEDEERAYVVDDTGESPLDVDDVDASLRDRALDRLEGIDVDRPKYVEQVDDATEQRLEDLGYL